MADNTIPPTPSSDLITQFLRDKESQDALAIAAEQENTLATEGFGSDLRNLSYAEITAKYGNDVARNRFRIEDGDARLRDHRANDSTLLQKIGDTALDAGAGLFSVSANTVGALAVRPLAKAAGVDPDAASVELAGLTDTIVGGFRDQRSDFANENSRIQGIQNSLDQEENARQYEVDIANGASDFTAGLQRAGRDFLDVGANVIQDPEAVREIIGGSLGSLGPSAALARGAQMAAAKGIGLLTASTRASTIAQTAAAATAIGAIESSGTYADTLNKVMSMDADVLSASPVYSGLLEEGFTPNEARIQLANISAEEAFASNLPAAIAMGILSKKFETAPIGSFADSGIIGGLRQILGQGLEEAGQGISGTLSGNSAIINNADANQPLFEGVGEAAAQGLIGGIGQAGITAIPSTASSLIGSVVDASSARTFNDPLTQEIQGRENIVSRASDVISSVAEPIVNRARGTDNQQEDVAAVSGSQIQYTAQQAVNSGDASPELAQAVSDTDTTPIPEKLQTEVAKGESFLERVSRVTQTLADKKVKLTEGDEAVVGAMYSKLKSMQPSLPANVKSQVKSLLQTPQARRFEQRLNRLDLNTTQTEATVVTPDVVAETVAVARTNPTNVNPVVAAKILRESGETLSDEDVRIMSSASKIASIVNDHQGEQVQISTDRDVALTKLNRPSTSKPITIDETSRSLKVSGYTAADGKTGLRSINDFASDIFQGAQSPDHTFINEDGIATPVAKVMEQFSKLVTHMNNKVGALNESFSQNNRKGSGPSLPFAGLVGGETIVSAKDWKGTPVAYHRSNPNSVQFARRVAADQDAAVQVYNELRTAFPDQFGSLPEVQSVALLKDDNGYIDVDQLNAEIDAQEASDIAAVQADNELQVQAGDTVSTVDSLIEEVTDTTAIEKEETPKEISSDEVAQPTKENKKQKYSDEVKNNTRLDLEDIWETQIEEGIGGNIGGIGLTEVGARLAFDEAIQDVFNGKQQARDQGDKRLQILADTTFSIAKTYADRNQKDYGNIDDTSNKTEKVDDLSDVQILDTPETIEVNTHETFTKAYQEDPSSNAPANLDDYLSKMESSTSMNTATVAFAKKLVRPLIGAMNKRIANKSVKLNKKSVPLTEAIKAGDVQTFRQYRNTAIVNPETGQYDQNLIELAGIAFVDWLSSATGRDPSQLDDTLEELGISYNDMTDAQLEAATFGVSTSQAKAQISRDIVRMWGRQENVDASLAELVGIAEGIANEMITTLSDTPNINLIDVVSLPMAIEDGKQVVTETILVKGLEDIQGQIKEAQGEGTNKLAREELFQVASNTYSVGQKLPSATSSNKRGSLNLSELEEAAINKMQDTPHFKDEVRADLMLALGEDTLKTILGYVEGAEEIKNNTYRRSVLGRNLSVTKNIKDAFEVLGKLKDGETPIYYPVGVTKTGRHQYQGVNPQSNKILRSLVTPTWSELNLSNQDDVDNFWLGVAQASDLFKVEKMAHTDVLDQVKDKFFGKYRTAVDLIRQYNQTGDIDGQAFIDAVGNVEPQVLASIQAVASLEDHQASGAETMSTSLSFEMDGLTNGAANMMVNFGQGEITNHDFHNFNRIGLFMGQVGKTVNQYFSARSSNGAKNLDLYERTSGLSQSNMFEGLKNMKPSEREATLAAGRFAARFGNFEIVDGQISMTRNTAKNPMTKVNYGSSVGGVGRGVADDMLIKFYEKIQGIPANVDLETYFQYPGMQADIRTLFGDTLPDDLGGGAFEFPASAVTDFQAKISDTLGEVLTGSTKNVIGDKITELNDMLVFSTNVQSQYVQLVFQERLEELAQKRADEGKIRTNKSTGKPVITDLSRRDYNSVVRDMEKLSPLFVSDDQTLAVGGFQNKRSNMELSSDMDGSLRQKSELPMPEDVGVAAIPYSVIGTGDAMMMNFIFGSEGAPTDVLGIFDGLDVPVSKIKEYASYVNEQVLKTWERDVLAMVTANFDGFLSQTKDDPLLQQAFQNVQDKNKKTSIVVSSPSDLSEQLRERHRQNAARKAVLKRIPVSVDQMGGSDVGYTREGEPVSLMEINRQIQNELDGRKATVEDVKVPVQESTADAVLKGMRMSSEQRKVADILKPLMKGVRVVFGTVDQANNYRQENFEDDGQVIKGNSFDAANNVIFLNTKDTQTILHEMVHAATYSKVLDHYEGNTNDAVARLEDLMKQFLDSDFKGKRVNEAKAAILRELAQNDAASKAAAVNEFMAYALSNNQVRSLLQGTEASLMKTVSQKVIQLMRRIMGAVPTSMFDHVVFNTKVLNGEPVSDVSDGGGGGSGDNGNDGGSSDEGGYNGFTNFWINTIRKYVSDNFEDAKSLKASFNPTLNLADDADKVIDGFRQAGMLANHEQLATFRAIYMVMRSQIKLDPASVVGLTRVFKHIEENLTADMFGSYREANYTYSAIISSFNGNDAAAVLLALSQTSNKFKAALEQVPDPQGEAQVDGSLTQVMQRFGQIFLNKVMGSVDLENRNVQEIMNELADGMVDQDVKAEYSALHKINSALSTADNYVSGKMSQLSDFQRDRNEKVSRESRSQFKRILSGTVTLGTNLLDKTNSAFTGDAAKMATHMNVPFASLVPIREMVSEIIGTDTANQNLVAMQDAVNSKISGMRQAYREDLPVILQDQFARHPEAQEWEALHTVLGKLDITRFIKPSSLQYDMRMLSESNIRNTRISNLEAALDANMTPSDSADAKLKGRQLADFMNGKGAGVLLMRNPYAIIKNLDGAFNPDMVEVLDELISIYALDSMDAQVRESVVNLWNEDPSAVSGLVSYIQGLNKAEDSKHGISEQAKLNAYKGFIPNHGDKNTRIIIDLDGNEQGLKKRGFTKLAPYTGVSKDSEFGRSYYITTTSQGGAYSQGVMQNVQSTFRGVDINTGLSVTGETSGFISDGHSVERITERMTATNPDVDAKETMLPVFGEDGSISGYEMAINPDLYAQHMSQDQNLAVMLGAWAGRHVEEALAAEYNRTLIDQLHDTYMNREKGTDDLYVNLKETDDPIYAESFKLWPQGIKLYADGLFDGTGPMVRKDQVNLSTGYREFSVADFWSGKTRMPEEVQATVRNVSTLVMGSRALSILSSGEKFLQGSVSTAKDIIVIRSLVVPMANTVSNVVQLATRGVPVKQVVNGYRKKLVEIEEYNRNVTELIELEAKLRLYANNDNQRRIINSKIKVIQDLNARMTVAPIIEAGAYKNLSEGLTDLDADITKGRFGDLMESLASRLPDRLETVAKVGLVSKSTELYRVANRATQYGDFLAKAIYYDHLMSDPTMDHDKAIAKMNEEFVNFSALPGRVRSGLESFGLTWFMAFKIRIMKIAMQQLRDNPVRSLAVNQLLPDIGSPLSDNLGQVILDDRLDYATGYDMMFDAPGLNPWVNLVNG